MSGPAQLGLAFTPYTVAASSEHEEHPAAYMTSRVHPQRPWWALDTDATPTVTIDQGSALAVAAIYLDNVNFPDVLLETSSDGASWTPYDLLDLPSVTRLQSTAYPRRAGYALLTGVSTRYLRLSPGLLDAGHAQHQIGTLVLCPSIRTLTRNFNTPWTLGKAERVTTLDYANDGAEVHNDGRPRIAGTLVANPWPRPECTADFYALDAVPVGSPFLLIENNDDASAAYLVTKTADLPRAEYARWQSFTMDVRGFG